MYYFREAYSAWLKLSFTIYMYMLFPIFISYLLLAMLNNITN